MDDVKVVRANEAIVHSYTPTETMSFLLSGGAGEPDVIMEEFGEGDGPPLHRHPWATWSVVIEGRIRLVAGDDDLELGPGDFAYTGPNVPHSFVGLTDNVKTVEFNWPGGRFEPLFGAIAPMFMEEGGPDFGKIAATSAEHGVEILGPPLGVPA